MLSWLLLRWELCWGDGFKTTLSLNHDGTTTPAVIADNVIDGGGTISIKVVFDKRVPALLTGQDLTDAVGIEDAFTIHDIQVAKAKDQSDRDVATTLGAPELFTGSTNNKEFMFSLGAINATALSADGTGTGVITVEVKVLANRVRNNDVDDRVNVAQNPLNSLGYNAEGKLTFTIIPTDTNRPTATIDAATLPNIVLGATADPSFSFKVTLSEKPAAFGKDHIAAKNATVDAVVKVSDTEYTVVVKPLYESKDDIELRVKPFERNKFPRTKSVLTGASKVKVNSDENKKVGLSGTSKNLTNKVIVPAGGYLVVTKDKAMSLIMDPGNAEDDSAKIARREKASQQTYNMIAVDLGINLEGFLIRGGTIDLISPDAGLVISEIMWATDGGSRDRQWVEIANTTAADIKFGDGTHKLMLYEAGEPLPVMDAASNIVDRVSTLYKGTNHWPILGRGQSGRTEGLIERRIAGVDQDVDIAIAIVEKDRLASMERAMKADGSYGDGTMMESWGQSMPPSRNFVDAAGGLFIGSPGADPINSVDVQPETDTTVPGAMAADIAITEIMVDTGNGRLPQWIELTNISGKEVKVDGWSLEIENSAADADVVGTSISIDLSGTIGVYEGTGRTMGQTLLLVAGSARSSSNLSKLGDRLVDVSDDVDEKGRYTLLSPMGFLITLLPPQTTGVVQYGDMAGNLDAATAWDIPMSDTGRSSIIRRQMNAAGMMTEGTEANGWVLASDTPLVTGPTTWYGSDEDAGTPGYDAGGPLPVELSHFRPARDKATGAVVITWSTQSELNNAGFFIKRSQKRNGEFKVVNPTMIVGAGTTSEKQFYTYTDTTAQPNIVYYYQIEDVSLDGNRQTLTNGIRLKGHIGAAGKLTSTWGELKSSNE